MPGFYTDGPLATDKGSIFDLEASAGDVFGAGFQRQIDTNPLALVGRNLRTFNEDWNARFGDGELIDQATAQKEVTGRGLDLKIPMGGISRYELDTLQYLKQRENQQNATTARGRGWAATASGFAGGLLGSFTDPLNVASGFIPIVGQARYAKWLADAGKGTFARAAVRSWAGALEGVAGAALIEPIVLAGANQMQLDYGLMDSFLNLTFGGVLGGGLHVIGGGVHDWASLPPAAARARQAAADAPEYLKRDAMEQAVKALEEDRPVEVLPVFGPEVRAAEMGLRKETVDKALAAYNAEVIPVGEQFSRLGDGAPSRLTLTRKELEDTYGDWDDVPQEIRDIVEKHGSVVEIGDKHGNNVEHFAPGKAPSEHDFMVQALEDEGYHQKQAADLDDVMDSLLTKSSNATNGVAMAFKAMAEDYGFTVEKGARGQWNRYQEVSRPATEAEKKLMAGAGNDPYESVTLKVRISDHPNLSSQHEAPSINIAPRADHLREVPDLLARATIDEDGNIVFREDQRAKPEVPGLLRTLREGRDDFDRQLAAEKAKPRDRIEAAKADEDDFGDLVDQYREQGHLTPDDEAALKVGDDLAVWAEGRAKAFEAAAQCIETA